ncbi:MAG: TetR/AcrR family transcriptional regulator [Myxococcota bacterium]
MPRAYTEQEQAQIREALLQVGTERFIAHGLGRVTVAELTAAVGIGKGSFYLFFESKEELFLQAIEHAEVSRNAVFLAALAPIEARGDGRAVVVQFFTLQAELLERHPLFRRLLEPGTIQRLTRKLSPDRLAAHRQGDRRWIGETVERWKRVGLVSSDLDPDMVFGLSAAMLALARERSLIGASFSQTLALIVRGIAEQLVFAPSTG